MGKKFCHTNTTTWIQIPRTQTEKLYSVVSGPATPAYVVGRQGLVPTGCPPMSTCMWTCTHMKERKLGWKELSQPENYKLRRASFPVSPASGKLNLESFQEFKASISYRMWLISQKKKPAKKNIANIFTGEKLETFSLRSRREGCKDVLLWHFSITLEVLAHVIKRGPQSQREEWRCLETTRASKEKNQTAKPSGTSKGFQQGSKITETQKPGAFLCPTNEQAG